MGQHQMPFFPFTEMSSNRAQVVTLLTQLEYEER
jgi:hypothetical protein